MNIEGDPLASKNYRPQGKIGGWEKVVTEALRERSKKKEKSVVLDFFFKSGSTREAY